MQIKLHIVIKYRETLPGWCRNISQQRKLMQIWEGGLLKSRWCSCVSGSWAHPCCLLTSSQLGGLNPHTRISSPQALWAFWTPSSRFNLPSSFTFINCHPFPKTITLIHCCFVLFCYNRFVGLQSNDLCCFISLLHSPVFGLFPPCSHSLSAESAEH